MPLHQIWLKLLGKGLEKVGPGPTGSKKKSITCMLLLPRKNIFTCMAGRNVPEAKQQVEEPGEVILVLILSPSHKAANGFMAA